MVVSFFVHPCNTDSRIWWCLRTHISREAGSCTTFVCELRYTSVYKYIYSDGQNHSHLLASSGSVWRICPDIKWHIQPFAKIGSWKKNIDMSESFEKLCIPIVISRDLMHSMSRIIMNYLIIKTKNKIDWPSFVHHCLCRLFLILLKVLYEDWWRFIVYSYVPETGYDCFCLVELVARKPLRFGKYFCKLEHWMSKFCYYIRASFKSDAK